MESLDVFDFEPTIDTMPRQPLHERGLQGPSVAHKIEELHTPSNIAFTTFSTGTGSLQNVIGVVEEEIAARSRASMAAFEIIGLREDDSLLVTYPPLVNVFPVEALRARKIQVCYLHRSSRASLLEYLRHERPSAIIGESSFIYAAMKDAAVLGFDGVFDEHTQIITAGTPLNLDMYETARTRRIRVHDLYGCQEFGWIACDGIPLRKDLSFIPVKKELHEVIVGGLPTGDCVPISESGHICNRNGRIITYRIERSPEELDVIIKASKLKSEDTVRRVAKSILRLKAKKVYVSPSLVVGAANTVLELKSSAYNKNLSINVCIDSAEKTELFDAIADAQNLYQKNHRYNEVWSK